jgi:hypothetical protein
MRSAKKILILSIVLVALVCVPAMAATTETCAFGDPNSTAASQCKGFVDGNTDGRCDKAADSILGAAAAALPASVGDTNGVAPAAPLPLAVVFIAFGVTGYFVVRGMNRKKR